MIHSKLYKGHVTSVFRPLSRFRRIQYPSGKAIVPSMSGASPQPRNGETLGHFVIQLPIAVQAVVPVLFQIDPGDTTETGLGSWRIALRALEQPAPMVEQRPGRGHCPGREEQQAGRESCQPLGDTTPGTVQWRQPASRRGTGTASSE